METQRPATDHRHVISTEVIALVVPAQVRATLAREVIEIASESTKSMQ